MRRPADGLGDESVWLGSLSSLLPERREHGYKLSAHGEVNKVTVLCLTALFSSIICLSFHMACEDPSLCSKLRIMKTTRRSAGSSPDQKQPYFQTRSQSEVLGIRTSNIFLGDTIFNA